MTLTKPQLAMLKQIAAGQDYLRHCGGMGARSAAKRVCMVLVQRGLLGEKTERMDADGSHPWTRWLGYEITDAGRAFLSGNGSTPAVDGQEDIQ